MAITPSYGWVTPSPTDFVTDLPADFEIFADAVDASFTADEGDLLVGGSSDIFEALPIGTVGQVLTSDGTTAEWATPSSPAPAGYTLINSGGTSLTSTITTVSGISGYDELWVHVDGASGGTASFVISVRLNSDTANHSSYGGRVSATAASLAEETAGGGEVRLAFAGSGGSGTAHGSVHVYGGLSSGIKPYQAIGGFNGSNAGRFQVITGGHYSGTGTLSAVSVLISTGTFNAGNVFVYGR